MTPTKIYRPGERSELDLCQLGARVVYDCSQVDVWTFQIDRDGVAWPASGVVTAELSNDLLNWYGFGSAVTKNAKAMTDMLEVSGRKYVSLRTSTVGSGTSPLYFNVTGWGRARALAI